MNTFNLEEYIDKIKNYQTLKYLMVTKQKIEQYHDILVSISGGSDSDIMLDMISKFDTEKKVKYIFIDTGLEYQTTRDHIKYLENKYGIKIDTIRPEKPIPTAVKNYGLPFLSKDISAKLYSLQNNDFDFKNDGWKPYEELIIKYPRIKSVIAWWTNNKDNFNISSNKYLKEFLIENPPVFKISDRCCSFVKKIPSKIYEKQNNIDLKVLGLRKDEGGIRTSKFKNCFTCNTDGFDLYRPLWFFTDKDKQYYKEYFNIEYSDCYEKWNFKRTGCCGCPFNSNYKEDLEKVKKYEPKIYKACLNIFGKSYQYTQEYHNFKNEMNKGGINNYKAIYR